MAKLSSSHTQDEAPQEGRKPVKTPRRSSSEKSPDKYAQWLLAQRGSVSPELDLEF
jgi:hypothetical protein